jgi:phosphatidate cytidylyltransferase
MLKQRLLTVAVVLPLFVGLIYLAPNAVWAAISAVAVSAGAFEWARLGGLSPVGRSVFVAVVGVSCAILLLLSVLLAQTLFDSRILYPLCLLATLFWILLVPAVLHFRWQLRQPWNSTIVGWLVLVPTWLAAVMMQRAPECLMLFLGAIWIADTAAYFTGRLFGRRKLAPRISPGKTIEGLAGAYVAVLVYITIVLRVYLPEAQLATYVSLWAFGFILTSLSVEGDLFESWVKRQAGAKDSGDLLPGHGGILDRIDSVTATIPFALLFFKGIVA